MEREEDNLEPEDHVATLCEIMARLADGSFATPFGLTDNSFRNTWPRGLGGSFPIWKEPTRRSSTVKQARSGSVYHLRE
jgi:hypothetical protein